MEQNVDASAPMAPATESSKQKGGNGLKIATAIACVVAVCGIGFGVYGMFFHKTEKPTSNCSETPSEIKENISIVEEGLPTVETINNLLREKYKLFNQDNFTTTIGTILSDYAYNEDGEGLSEAGKIFLVAREEYPHPNCDDTICYRTVSYEDLNNKYHEYFGDSIDIKKGIDYTHKHIFIGIDSIKYKEGDDSFEISYPNGIGGLLPASGYYTNIVDIERNNDGNIVATAIVTKVDAEDAKLSGTGSCLDAFECPDVNIETLKIDSSLYEFIFIEDNNTYKLKDIVKR